MERSKARKCLYFYDYSQAMDSSQCLIISLIITSYSEAPLCYTRGQSKHSGSYLRILVCARVGEVKGRMKC